LIPVNLINLFHSLTRVEKYILFNFILGGTFMLFRIVGIEKVDYTSKNTGDRVRGTNLYVHYPSEDRPGLQGERCDKLYVKEAIDCSSLSVGDDIEVYYNRYGKVDMVHLA